jgi:predicted metal-binding protein
MPNAVTLFVCTTCRRAEDAEGAPRAGGVLAGVLAEAPRSAGVAVQPVECLANCKRGPSAAMTRHGGWSYVFGGLDPAADAPALLEGAALLAASQDGLMPWRGRPEALKRGMLARIPPLSIPTPEPPR